MSSNQTPDPDAFRDFEHAGWTSNVSEYEAAFTRLATVLGGAAEGRAGTLLVSGTAGIGVTRYLNEAARRIGELEGEGSGVVNLEDWRRV